MEPSTFSDFTVIFCTCDSVDQARRIATDLVESHLAACVNLLPQVESIYRWQGKVEQAQEILMLVKTSNAQFAAVRDRITQLHSYDTPEIIALPIAAGSEKYLSWLGSQF